MKKVWKKVTVTLKMCGRDRRVLRAWWPASLASVWGPGSVKPPVSMKRE